MKKVCCWHQQHVTDLQQVESHPHIFLDAAAAAAARYESGVDYDLQHVVIAIPLPHTREAPTVNQVGATTTTSSSSSSILQELRHCDD
jgi:hypothetical protein